MMQKQIFQDVYRNYIADFPRANILELNEPDLYACEITSLQKSKSVLTVHAYSDNPTNTIPGFKLEFLGASYFELFPEWDGLNLSIAPPSECVNLLRQSKYANQTPSEQLLGSILFTIQSKHRLLRIIAFSLAAYTLHSKDDYLASLK